jgi:hypothetical protein
MIATVYLYFSILAWAVSKRIEGKQKLSLCLLKQHAEITSGIVKVKFHAFSPSALHNGKVVGFTLRLHYHPENKIEGEVGSRACLDVVIKRESIATAGNRTSHYQC